LQKISEDSTRDFNSIQVDPLLAVLLPKLIQHTDSPDAKIRAHALATINEMLVLQSPTIQRIVEAYIQALSRRATDQAGQVRKLVCHAFLVLLDSCPEVLVQPLESIAQFMLFAMQDSDDAVSLEACEFWLALAGKQEFLPHLRVLLPTCAHLHNLTLMSRLIPVLIKSMAYTDIDIVMLGGDDDDAAVPDRQEDMKPLHYKSKSHTAEHGDGGKDDGENESDSEDDEDEDDVAAEWNLRKCSAATIDLLSNVFGNEMLTILLPLLNDALFHQDWKHREAGVLALGAIAEGLFETLDSF
jgi:transportin-1